jgi:hypothetical protein
MNWSGLQMEYKIQIIAFSAGVLIAFVTTFFAFKFAKRQENLKQKRIYNKALSIIDANLDWKLNQINRLDTIIVLLKESSIIEKEIIINKFPANFNSSMLQSSIEYLIEYKDCDDTLIRTLTFFLNHIEELNYQLDFSHANKTISTLSNSESIEKGIVEYFDIIKTDYIEKIIHEINFCKSIIREEKIKSER